MINLKERSNKTEILDEEDLSFEDVKICIQELNAINTTLGGHSITLQGVESFYPDNKNLFSVCEIGSGGGDAIGISGS